MHTTFAVHLQNIRKFIRLIAFTGGGKGEALPYIQIHSTYKQDFNLSLHTNNFLTCTIKMIHHIKSICVSVIAVPSPYKTKICKNLSFIPCHLSLFTDLSVEIRWRKWGEFGKKQQF